MLTRTPTHTHPPPPTLTHTLTQVSLTRFWSKGTPHVFACSDRPAVVHSANQKLLYSNVNVKEVTHIAPYYAYTYTSYTYYTYYTYHTYSYYTCTHSTPTR